MYKQTKKKRLLSFCLSLLIAFSGFVGLGSLSAGAVSVNLGYNINDIKFTLSNGTYHEGWYVKTVNGSLGYCVEPGVAIEGDYSSILATDNNVLKMSLADYFGRYMKTGSVLNTQDSAFNAYYTQLYVWEILGVMPTSITDWGGSSTGKYSLASYNTWKAEVQPKIDAYLKTVSFAGQTVSLKAGETKTLTDTAGAFSNYTVLSNTSSTTLNKTGESLKITADANSKDGTIKYQWYIDPAYREASYYWNSNVGGQKMVTLGISSPKEVEIKVTVEKKGGIKIIKELTGTELTAGNDCYGSVTEAEFSLYDKDKKLLQSGIKVLASGEMTIKDLTAGEYFIQETKAPRGFALDDSFYPVTVKAGETATVSIENIPLSDPIGIILKKIDSQTGETPQGNKGLLDAEFTVKYYDEYYFTESELSGKLPLKTWVLKTDENGRTRLNLSYLVSGDTFYLNTETMNPIIPLGTITIQETKAPTGYEINDELFIRQIRVGEDGVSVVTYNAPEIPDEVKRGGVQVQKLDAELVSGAQGDATLAGTEIDIINLNENPVYVNGTVYAKDESCAILTTDATGSAKSAVDLLPMGRYRAVEKTAPDGYLNTGSGLSQEFEITEENAGKLLLLLAPLRNNVIRGGVQIEKWDAEINTPEAQGGATLEGTEIELYNQSVAAVVVEGVTYQPGELISLLVTGEDGTVTTANDYLPNGTYLAKEKNPPAGYLPTGTGLEQIFEIRNPGEIVVLTGEQAIKNNPIRGDLKGVKIADGGATHERLANVPFQLTSATTGESHVVVTDTNGEFNTSSAWNLHSQNTNRGETSEDGVWFGDINALDDSKGALLYDDYWVEELPCEANEGLTLIAPFKVSVYRDSMTIDLGTLTDIVPPTPAIGTTATEQKTGLSEIEAKKEVTISDTVRYENLISGTEYTLKGVLMDKSTGEPLLINGEQLVNEKQFVPSVAAGVVRLTFTFDASALQGKSVVVFERLYQNDIEVAIHADIEDEGQTVTFYAEPEIETSAAEAGTGDKEIMPGEIVTIIDTVTYTKLVPGQEYVLKGVLMDKETGKALLVDGKEIIAEYPFTPESASGTVSVPFEFSASALAGKTIVVFEYLYQDGKEVAVHTDIQDEGQTVRIRNPEIGTQAAEKGTDSKEIMPEESVTIIDTVSYSDLTPGKAYTLKGVLMDKETGKALLVDGKEITAEYPFTPESASGTVNVPFEFSASVLAGKIVVVFEYLYQDGKEVAVHTDIQDEGQTVRFRKPEIGTQAAEKETGSKEILPEESVTIIDTVSYTDLTPGREYVLKGVLMDKETGKALLVNDKEVTAEYPFTPESASGTVNVPFEFSASALAGKTVVVFEYLYQDGKEVAVHTDIQDEGQTVRFRKPEIGTKATEKGTGSKQLQPKKNVSITDAVSYTDLTPGKEYIIKGILMDKATGKALLVDGKEITSGKKFTPKTADGTVDIVFTFDGSALAGKTVVVFETLYVGEKELAVHADINDKAQTVTFETPPVPEISTPKTGDTAKPIAQLAIVFGIAFAGLAGAGFALWRSKKRKGEQENGAVD